MAFFFPFFFNFFYIYSDVRHIPMEVQALDSSGESVSLKNAWIHKPFYFPTSINIFLIPYSLIIF